MPAKALCEGWVSPVRGLVPARHFARAGSVSEGLVPAKHFARAGVSQ